jgi:cyclopentanol dehydrogenase
MGKLDGKVALISGGARGQGAAEAETFAREGARVVFGDIRDAEGQKVEAAIRAGGGEATYVHLDVTSEPDWQRAVGSATERYGRLDILINNAAIVIPRVPIEERTVAEWDQVMAVNARGVFLGTKHAIPAMRRSGGGSIVNISSVAGVKATPRVFAYATAKGGLQALTRSVAADFASDRIRCNTVIVGFVISNPLARKFAEDAAMSRAMRATMLTEFGEPEDIAHVVRFLASSESAFMTGTDLYADGGATVKHVLPGTKQEARRAD